MSRGTTFTDRADAGRRLATALRSRGIEADLVLAVPRGGLPVGRPVADALDAPLDIVVAKKIGAPGNPEYAIGAVASDGTVWRNERAIRYTNASDEYFERHRRAEAESAREKARRYRGGDWEPDVSGKRVVLVDDGVATGATVRACLRMLKEGKPTRLVLAVPVGSPETIDELGDLADEVVCIESPAYFRAVGQAYRRFDQVSDEEAMRYLDETR